MDYPVMFSPLMVRALIDGRKSMTRRTLRTSFWLKVKCDDLLWVREEFKRYFKPTTTNPGCIYLADCHEFSGNKLIHQIGADEIRWTSMVKMPRTASRLTLTMRQDARVQRLQDISEADAMSEGWPEGCGLPPTGWFANLWNNLHGLGAWERNPLVVVLSFTVEKRNIDQEQS